MCSLLCTVGRQTEDCSVSVRQTRSGIAHSDRGSASIEYAILLGAIACAVIAGLFYYRDLGIPAFDLSRTLAEGCDPARVSDLPRRVDSDAEDGEVGTTHRHNVQASSAANRPAILFCTAAIAGLMLFGAFRFRRRKTRVSGVEEQPDDDNENRLHTKRQILWKNILNDPRLLLKNRVEVRHLMTRDVSVVSRRTPVEAIRRLMTEKHMHHVLVCDSDGRLEGVVSDRDLNGDPNQSAADVMTAEPIAVRPDTTASAAIVTLLERQISCVPVVEDDCLRGILTRTDLLVSLQCMLQWWLRFAQTLARAAECSDTIDGVQGTNGRRLFQQRVRLQTLTQSLGPNGKPSETSDWESFAREAEAFLATAGELIAMQTFEGDRLSQMAGELLEITKS